MKEMQEGMQTMKAVVAGQKFAKTVSKYMKRKIPGALRAEWYEELVVPGLVAYNNRCDKWLKENVK